MDRIIIGLQYGLGFFAALVCAAGLLCGATYALGLLAGLVGRALLFAVHLVLGNLYRRRLKRWEADPRREEGMRFGKPIYGLLDRSLPWDKTEFHRFLAEGKA